MPIGHFVRWKSPDFEPVRRDKYLSQYWWSDFVSKMENVEIQHGMNSSSEKRIGPYPVNGFGTATNP
jgi:hypothetical protein